MGRLAQPGVYFPDGSLPHLQVEDLSSRNGLEIQIAADGGVRLNGLVPVEDILSFRQELALLGLQTN